MSIQSVVTYLFKIIGNLKKQLEDRQKEISEYEKREGEVQNCESILRENERLRGELEGIDSIKKSSLKEIETLRKKSEESILNYQDCNKQLTKLKDEIGKKPITKKKPRMEKPTRDYESDISDLLEINTSLENQVYSLKKNQKLDSEICTEAYLMLDIYNRYVNNFRRRDQNFASILQKLEK